MHLEVCIYCTIESIKVEIIRKLDHLRLIVCVLRIAYYTYMHVPGICIFMFFLSDWSTNTNAVCPLLKSDAHVLIFLRTQRNTNWWWWCYCCIKCGLPIVAIRFSNLQMMWSASVRWKIWHKMSACGTIIYRQGDPQNQMQGE